MRIQHNIMAMNAYRNYKNNTSALSKNLERLSSGYKINRAGDDAAGLAISEKMRAQITGLEAAQKNVKDGISLVNTAEGAMQEIQDMLNRMVSLATQSANGTYDNEVDRANLQAEVDQLRSEIDRIADSANFNGIKLLDGSLDTEGNPTVTGGSDRIIEQELAAGEDPALVTGTRTILDGAPATEDVATVFEMDFSDLKAVTSAEGTKAVYQGAEVTTAANITPADNKLTIGGVNINVTATSTIDDIKTALEADAGFNAAWTIAKSADGKSLEFTAKTAGALDSAGAPTTAQAAGLDKVTDGEDAVAAKAELTIAQAAANAASIGSNTVDLTQNTNQTGSDTTNGYSWTTVDDTANSGNYIVTVTRTGANASTNGTVDGIAFENGKAAVEAVYKLENVADKITTATTASGSLSVDGKAYDVTKTDLADQLEEWAAAYNKDTANTDYTASVSEDGKSITYTAKKGGEIGGSGPADAPDGVTTDPIVEGAEAGAGDIKTSVKLNNVDIAEDIELAAGDDAAAIAKKIFENSTVFAAGTKDGDSKFTDVDLFGDGTKYTVELDGSKLKFTLESMPTAENIKGNFDWDVDIEGANFVGNHTAGTNVVTPGSVASGGVRANTVFGITLDDLKDGAKITIDDKTVTLSVGVNSTVKAGDGVVTLTEDDIKDLNLALSKISKGFGGETTNFEVSVNNGANSDAKTGLAVYKKADSKNTYTTKDELAGIFSLSTPGKGEGKALTLQIGDTSDSYNQLNVSVKDMHCTSLGIDGIDISNPEGASTAINVIRQAINTVSAVRGNLGAISNRLDHTANNLSVMAENITDAESTIRDTDIAEEMMAYTKNNILVQSAQAMLAQANQVPQGVLQLLQ